MQKENPSSKPYEKGSSFQEATYDIPSEPSVWNTEYARCIPSSEFSMVPTLLFKVSSAQEELIGKMTLEEKAGQLTILAEPKSEVGVVFLVIWKTRDRISMMKYQVAQRNLSYLLHFKPVVNESITMNVFVITQSYYKPSLPQLSSFTFRSVAYFLTNTVQMTPKQIGDKSISRFSLGPRAFTRWLISQDTIRPCNPDINPEVGDANKQVHDGDGDDHGDYAGCIQYTMYII